MKLHLLAVLSIIATSVLAAPAAGAGNNLNPAVPPTAPQAGTYFNAAGKYAGTTTTVNGATSYYQDGKYQGQAPANSNLYLNQTGKVQQISK